MRYTFSMLIVANWKAYVETPKKAKVLLASAKRLVGRAKHTIVLAPSFPHLGLITGGRKGKLCFGAQDVSLVEGGAATGEVTATTLVKLGVSYVIIGHSERRAMGETNEIVRAKVEVALAHRLTPIIGVGERERDIDARYLGTLRSQIDAVIEPLTPQQRAKVVIAYEPIWAIGKSASDAITPNDLAEMVLYIRKVLIDYMPERAARRVRILYGGSVERENARELAATSRVNGFLVGHASADTSSFASLVKAIS